MIIKRNKFFIFVSLIMLFIIFFSFFEYYKERFTFARDYNIIKENCYEKKNLNHEYCKIPIYNNQESLEKYIKSMNPNKEEKIDAITLTSEIIMHNTLFKSLQFFSPLLIIIVVVGTLHSEISSGMFKNYLTMMDYKKYLRESYKVALKAAMIIPVSLILVFVISMFVTGFNFNISDEVKQLAVYNEWQYSNFLLYGIAICIIQYFISLLFANIGLYCCKKNKNKLVAIIMGYLIFLLVDLFIYLILYVVIINNILGFKELTDYFNITGYWFFDNGPKFLIVIPISFALQFISGILLYNSFKKKERLVIEHEKQMG